MKDEKFGLLVNWNYQPISIGLLVGWLSLAWVSGEQNWVFGDQGKEDLSTHHSDHDEDTKIESLPMVHVHGFRLNKDQQLGPVPQKTPWPTIPPDLEGKDLDDWVKVRILVTSDGAPTVVILQPATHRELTLATLETLKQWTFLPQMDGDVPVDGVVNIRVHFRTK